ncbi:MAG: hypothetical protein M3R55_09615 [Acidobacteriota bacterium]|nr:hypothetical protein [Acidobacteriota bacterium]
MTDKDGFKERGRALEDEYFHRKERELIAKLREKAGADEARQKLGEHTGVADPQLLQDLQELGYTPDTISLLHLVPLVQMTWADGSVSGRERDLIIEAARARGVESGSAADQQLQGWLKTRPSDTLFTTTLRVIGAMLQSRPAGERDASSKDLLAYVTSIASASGGVLGFGAVSDQERAVLDRITAEIARAHASTDVLPKS